MKVCIIGGAGYIGSELAFFMSGKGHNVTVVDPNPYDIFFPSEIIEYRMKYDPYKIPLDNFDVVYHLAAVAGIGKCEKLGMKKAIKENVDITTKILYALKGNENTRLVFASTSAIYASSSIYSISKLMSEYYISNRPNSTCLRLGTVYGISSNMRDGLLVHDMVKQAVERKHVTLWHNHSFRPFISIKDVVDYMAYIVEDYGFEFQPYFNLASENMSKYDLALLIRSATGCGIKMLYDIPMRFEQDFEMTPDVIFFRKSNRLKYAIQELVDYYERR